MADDVRSQRRLLAGVCAVGCPHHPPPRFNTATGVEPTASMFIHGGLLMGISVCNRYVSELSIIPVIYRWNVEVTFTVW
jgi:hypothetical protein